MKKFLFLILICYMTCNGVFAQSLGKMTLGCKRTDIPLSLPSGFNICKTNTSNQLTYTTNNTNEYVSFYLKDNIVDKIVMNKFIAVELNTNNLKSKLEEVIINLYDTWGEPSYVGENIYWKFPTSKATFSYTISTDQLADPLGFSGGTSVTRYKCYAEIKLERTASLFE